VLTQDKNDPAAKSSGNLEGNLLQTEPLVGEADDVRVRNNKILPIR